MVHDSIVALLNCSIATLRLLLHCFIVSSFDFAQDFGLHKAVVIFLFSQI